jgi:DNA-binding MarR family transcriptional regulator
VRLPLTVSPVPETEIATRLRAAIGRLHRQLRRTTAGTAAGLTPTRISVLFTVARRGPIRLSDLAVEEDVNPTMLSRVVSDLGDAGLLERINDPGDRRAAHVKITPDGRQLVERMRSERTDVMTRALSELPTAERKRIEQALPALEQLGEALKRRRP